MTYGRISVERLAPAVGAEISGVDLREPLEDGTYAEIRRALLEHGVIFFRDQTIDHEQHLAFGRRFGELHIHPASPCVDGRPELMQVHTDANSARQNGDRWHSDVSCDEEPPMGSVLHLHTVPECGGDTLFSSMYAAWDALSEPMKALLAPLEASHESAHLYDHLYGGEMVKRRNAWPSAVHPVVRTHPETGRKALFVNSIFTRRILGVTESESRALLEYPVRARDQSALPVPLPLAQALHRVLGQPLRPAPRHVGLPSADQKRNARHGGRRSAVSLKRWGTCLPWWLSIASMEATLDGIEDA